jgi:LuxR family maltose regulon positive regulatory protein
VCHLAKLHVRRGQLHQARAVYERALALATDTQGQPLPIASEPLFGLGELARQWNELEKATDYLLQGIELSEKWNRVSAIDAYIPLVRVKQAQGDVRGAHDALEKARQLALESESTELDDLAVALQQARLWVAQGETAAAMRWIEERGIELSTLKPFPDAAPGVAQGLDQGAILSALNDEGDFVAYHFRKYEYLVLSRLLLAQDQPAEALALLESLLSVIEARQRNDLVIDIQILKALAFQQQDNIHEAMHALERALSLAQPGGHVSIFTDEGEPMARLVRHAAARGIRPPYVGKLLAALDASAEGEDPQSAGRPHPGTQPLVEPISDRELEVLQLLGAGLSNPEIAEELIISVHTVRSHVKNIYGKLNVHKRWDAVQRARELGLL